MPNENSRPVSVSRPPRAAGRPARFEDTGESGAAAGHGQSRAERVGLTREVVAVGTSAATAEHASTPQQQRLEQPLQQQQQQQQLSVDSTRLSGDALIQAVDKLLLEEHGETDKIHTRTRRR